MAARVFRSRGGISTSPRELSKQLGKTTAAAFETRCHVTGRYPEWWDGARFYHAPLAWACGVNNQQIVDVLQKAIFGQRDGDTFDGTGMVELERIKSVRWNGQLSSLAESVKIRHERGTATLQFKAYSSTGSDKKKAQALAGTTRLDFLLVDEQPDPIALGQLLTRTMHGKHVGKDGEVDSGLVLIEFTPEKGEDDIYRQFRDEPGVHQLFFNRGWDDVEERIISKEQKERMLASIPAYEREMRSKGIPMLGGAVVFPVPQSEIEIPPFEIPAHFKIIIGIDFGIGHPFAAAKVAWDPEEDVIYLVSGYKESGALPAQHMVKLRAMGQPDVPVSYPHDGDTREKRSGETLISAYKECGMVKAHQFRNADGSIYREPGILDMLNRMLSGRFKVFANVIDFFYEMRLYHRKNGTIVDANDDLISATRYACGMVKRFGVQPGRRKSHDQNLAAYYARMRKVG